MIGQLSFKIQNIWDFFCGWKVGAARKAHVEYLHDKCFRGDGCFSAMEKKKNTNENTEILCLACILNYSSQDIQTMFLTWLFFENDVIVCTAIMWLKSAVCGNTYNTLELNVLRWWPGKKRVGIHGIHYPGNEQFQQLLRFRSDTGVRGGRKTKKQNKTKRTKQAKNFSSKMPCSTEQHFPHFPIFLHKHAKLNLMLSQNNCIFCWLKITFCVVWAVWEYFKSRWSQK